MNFDRERVCRGAKEAEDDGAKRGQRLHQGRGLQLHQGRGFQHDLRCIFLKGLRNPFLPSSFSSSLFLRSVKKQNKTNEDEGSLWRSDEEGKEGKGFKGSIEEMER